MHLAWTTNRPTLCKRIRVFPREHITRKERPEPVAQDDEAGQPPDYNQTMNCQPFVLKPNNQFQYGYQIYGAGISQQQLSNASQQSFFASPNPAKHNTQVPWKFW